MPSKFASKASPATAIDILTEDHKHVMKMFTDFEKLRLDEDSDEDAKQILVERTCTELTIHSQVEEEFFYPALREALDDTSMLDEAEVEHGIASQLIAELESMQPDDELYDAKFTVLGEYVRHHIEEEQEKIFPKAKKAKLSLESLGEDIRQRKEELLAEFGFPEDDDAVEGETEIRRKKSSRKGGT